MDWSSDELHHRSAERSGWCSELRAADPDEVDETVAGAVEYAAQTGLPDDPDTLEAADLDADSYDAEDSPDTADPDDGANDSGAGRGDESDADSDDPPDSADADSDDPDSADAPDGYVCALCGGDIPDGEALDADGAPVDVGFQWAGEVEAYHRSCIDAGEGRFLPWAANGILRDETTG